MSKVKTGLIISAAVVGAGALGVAAGLLFAPVSGAETRRRLGRTIEEEAELLRRKGREALEQAGETASQRITRGVRKVGELIHS
jgi:gas vesicle protein